MKNDSFSLRYISYLCSLLAGLLLIISCQSQATEPLPSTPVPLIDTINIEEVIAQPIDEMLSLLSADARTKLAQFTANVPDPLPNELAYPLFMGFLPTLSRADGNPSIVQQIDGKIRLEGMVANPGSNPEQTNIVCLRNAEQIACSPEADVWAVVSPPKTLAIVSYEMEAKKGDMLAFVYIANNEPERLYIASIMDWVFVEEDPSVPDSFVQAPAHEKFFGGCDGALITDNLEDVSLFLDTQKRGTPLWLVVETCTPVVDELVRLIPIIDRHLVVDLPEEIWHKPVRLSNPSNLIPIDTTLLGNATEFQIAVVPLVDSHTEVADWWGWFPLTNAADFE
jgi:hypothetical protein